MQKEWRLFLPGEKRLVKAEKVPESAGWSRSWRGRAQSLGTCCLKEKLEMKEPWQDQEAASLLSEKKKFPIVQLARSKDLFRSKG